MENSKIKALIQLIYLFQKRAVMNRNEINNENLSDEIITKFLDFLIKKNYLEAINNNYRIKQTLHEKIYKPSDLNKDIYEFINSNTIFFNT